jgi:hypothetical protein
MSPQDRWPPRCADFFAGRIVQIDYGSNAVRLLQTSPRLATSIPIQMNYNAMCVPVTVDGNRLNRVRVDTGCDQPLHVSTTSLSAVERTKEKRSSIGLSKGATLLRHCGIQLGGLSIGNFPTTFHLRPIFPNEDGLLGNRALSEFIMTIDMRKRRLILESKS